jgi:agmatine deiminase
MPAEWEPHQATWISWPHNRETWVDDLPAVEAVMVEAVAALAEGELVHINVLDAAHERHVADLLRGRASDRAVRLHRVPTNDAWCRDHGAIFVVRDDGTAATRLFALDFDYNAWGGRYPPYDLDQAVPAQMAATLGVPRLEPRMVLEGGSVDVNGSGALLTTEQCLLNRNRNPTLNRHEIEACLEETLGVEQIIWLGEGIAGDDTDGHIDDVARFVAPATVVTAIEANRDDPNYAPLRANLRRLQQTCLRGGQRLEVVELPMPEPLYRGGDRLPASYANFYIANEILLLPVFGSSRDGDAQDILGGCFPGRRIVPIDCRALVVGLGALHCMTQQVPVAGSAGAQ